MHRSVFKLKDRRQVKPRSFVLSGFILGVCAANPISLLAQAQFDVSAWVQPPVVMSIIGVLVSISVTRQMVMDDRRRLTQIEANAVQRETFQETMRRIDESLGALTRDAEHRRHREQRG